MELVNTIETKIYDVRIKGTGAIKYKSYQTKQKNL